jgi:WD40 repeat protein
MRKLRRYWVIFWGAIVALLLAATSSHAAQNTLGQQPLREMQSTNISLKCTRDAPNAIRSIAFSPDRQFIAAGGRNESVKLWRIADGRLLRTFALAKSGEFGAVEFLSGSHLLVTNDNPGEEDRSYQLWQIDNGRLVWEIYENRVGQVFWTADRKFMLSVNMDSATNQTILSTWDASTGKITKIVRSESKNRFQSLQLADRDTLLLGKTDKNELQAWRIADGKLMWTIGDLQKAENLLVKDDRLAILSLTQQKINVYKVNNGQFLWSAPIETANIAKTSAPQDEDTYKIMSSPDARKLVIITPHQKATSENPARILTVRAWADGRRLWQQEFERYDSRNISIRDRTIGIVTGNNIMKTFDLNSGRILWVYQIKGNRYFSAIDAISPDRKVQVVDSSHGLEVWELDKPRKLMTLDEYKYSFNGTVTFSHDSQILAAFKDPSYEKFCLWNVAQKRKLSCMFGEQDTVGELFVTRDDRTVIAATWGGNINFWRMSDRQLLKTIHTQHGVLTEMVMTADGKTAITNGEDNRLRVWRVADGKLLWSAPAADIRLIDFSPNGRFVSAAGWRSSCGRRFSREYYSWRMQDGVAVPVTKETIDNLDRIEKKYRDGRYENNSEDRCDTLAVTTNKQTLVCKRFAKGDATRTKSGEIEIRRGSDGQILGRIDTSYSNEFVTLTRDARWIVTKSPSEIYIWSIKDGQLRKSIKVAPKEIDKTQVSANGRYLIVTFRATTLAESLEIWPMSKLINSL